MVHYTTEAYHTLCFSPTASERLRTDVPQLALTSTCLMHELLTFSACHLAYTRPDQRSRYLHRATWHQDRAIRAQREALVRSLTSSNHKAIYATSILVVICAFAALPSGEIAQSGSDPLGRLLDIFPLVNGMGAVLVSSDVDGNVGSFRGLFAGFHQGPVKFSCHNCLYGLSDRLLTLRERLGDLNKREGDPSQEKAATVIVTSLDSLRDCIREVLDASEKVYAPAELLVMFT
ncbi:hypothetical protein ACJZ2D_002139 [Fusarium nematophilum]